MAILIINNFTLCNFLKRLFTKIHFPYNIYDTNVGVHKLLVLLVSLKKIIFVEKNNTIRGTYKNKVLVMSKT